MNTNVHRISAVDADRREAIQDAAAVLQLTRSRIAAALQKGHQLDATVIGSGSEVNRWMLEAARTWRENLSVRPGASLKGLRISIPNNRACVAGGQQMISIFDDRISATAKMLLAGETNPRYLLSWAPVQMKIVNREFVLLQGPKIAGQNSVMAVRAANCLKAALQYWTVIYDAAYACGSEVAGIAELSPRQQQIAALLSDDAHDEAIAHVLGISVRTVRSDIAALMAALGVRSRFAAGQRLTEQLMVPRGDAD